MWKGLYDSLLQELVGKWAVFIQRNGQCGQTIRDLFREDIYPIIGLALILITVAVSLLYYHFFNRRYGNYYQVYKWFIFMGINAVLVGGFTWFWIDRVLGNPCTNVSTYTLYLILLNMIYSCFTYFLFVFIFKWGSPMGRRTPF